MSDSSIIEFYAHGPMIAAVRSPMVPPAGALISIRGKTWRVLSISYALDHADKYGERVMRANVELVPA